YLQDRVPGRTPRWRGVTLLHELAERRVAIAVASDNCRDAFYGFGDHDPLEVFREATRVCHLDRPYGDWPRAVTTTPADLMGLSGAGRIGPGLPADLVLFEGRMWSELLSRPQANRVVLRNGRAIGRTLPDYPDLDDLLGRGRARRGLPRAALPGQHAGRRAGPRRAALPGRDRRHRGPRLTRRPPGLQAGPTNPMEAPHACSGKTSIACSPVLRTPRAGGGT